MEWFGFWLFMTALIIVTAVNNYLSKKDGSNGKGKE